MVLGSVASQVEPAGQLSQPSQPGRTSHLEPVKANQIQPASGWLASWLAGGTAWLDDWLLGPPETILESAKPF